MLISRLVKSAVTYLGGAMARQGAIKNFFFTYVVKKLENLVWPPYV